MQFTDLDTNTLFGRTHIETQIQNLLRSFSDNCKDVNFKKGIYIYGSPGCGKTQFVLRLLKKLNYDVIKYDAGDVRNKTMIDTITSNNVSNYNVLHLMKGTPKKIAIVMDEIDGMNSGDKGGITALIKLIRQKKTKKQRLEHSTLNPIICIGNYFVDKKIKELMKVCHTFELKAPTSENVRDMIETLMPNIQHVSLKNDIQQYVQSDMRKIAFLHSIYLKKPEMITSEMIHNIFHTKNYNDDSKRIIQHLFSEHVPIEDHNTFMNETDRTTVALLWHENVVDKLEKMPKEKSFPFYLQILRNICFADYIDRITFQNQIWLFNEMSSMMKTFYNNKLFHEYVEKLSKQPIRFKKNESNCLVRHSKNAEEPKTADPENVRFTKVLTKYSTEYNNLMFVFMLCQEMDMDRADMISFFQELRLMYGSDFFNKSDKINDVEKIFVDTNITKLDIKRIYRYLDKNVKRDTHVLFEDEGASDDDDA